LQRQAEYLKCRRYRSEHNIVTHANTWTQSVKTA
jgi:hypothetical protein